MKAADSAPHAEAAPVRGPLWTRFTISLAILVALMTLVLALRFVYGIGAVTNLNDGYPWGIWIAFDVVVGTALGAGGFSVAFLTYIVNRGEYHPIVRPALLTALFGYVQAGLSVGFDIGRYWDFWHIFVPRYAQVNSVMFEVAVCITAYIVVSFIEFSPAILERLGWKTARRKLERVLFVFVAIGILLPLMHQSSLGSLLLVFGPQVHPLYLTRLLPLLFLVSCVGMGLAAVVLEGTLSALWLNRPPERDLLGRLTWIGALLGAAFVVLRFVDLTVRGALPLAFEARGVTLTFWLETVLFSAPIALLASQASRRNMQRLFVAAALLALAGVIYRLSAYLVAYETGAGFKYFPSLGEIAVTVGLVAFEVLAFIIAVRLLPVLPKADHPAEPGLVLPPGLGPPSTTPQDG
jgi:Ni/Fe-hydrogenase subunit HybB-like protein